MNHIFPKPKRHDVERILLSHSLPVDDLADVELVNFFGCGEQESPKGVIGLEIHGADGLLRSLAVEPEVQGKGCGASLLDALEKHSKSVGVENLYLLTESAEEYFKKKGFEVIDRECASQRIKQTTQFNSLCPSSATLMRKVMQS
jgi:amino-acid N-acetyltransferase